MAREARSRGDVLLLIAVLAAFGLAVSGYLVYVFYAPASWCDFNEFWNCGKVRDSPFASVAGIPTAAIGAAGFAAILALAVLGLRGVERLGPWTLHRWLLLLAVAGALLGLGLTFVELFVIRAVCILCAAGFAIDLGLLVSVDGLR